MQATERFSPSLQKRQQILVSATLACLLLLIGCMIYFTVKASEASHLNARSAFESSRWNALQLQVQTNRFTQYLQTLQPQDFPLKGNSFFQYELVMSRVDLLRNGQIGQLVNTFSGGRVTRLMNIINGDFELIGEGLARLEKGDMVERKAMLMRLKTLDSRINEMVVLVNQGANDHVTEKRNQLEQQLTRLQQLCSVLAVLMVPFMGLMISHLRHSNRLRKDNDTLKTEANLANTDRSRMMACFAQQLRPPANELASIFTPFQTDASTPISAQNQQRGQMAARQLEDNLAAVQAFTNSHEPLQLNHSVLNVEDLFHTLVSQQQSTLALQKSHLICQVDSSLPKTVVTDFTLIRQIIEPVLAHIGQAEPRQFISMTVQPSELKTGNVASVIKHPIMFQCHIQTKATGLFSDKAKAMLRMSLIDINLNNMIDRVCTLGIGVTLMHFRLQQLGGRLRVADRQDQGLDLWLDIPCQQDRESGVQQSAPLQLSGHIDLLTSAGMEEHRDYLNTLTSLLHQFGIQTQQRDNGVQTTPAADATITIYKQKPIAIMNSHVNLNEHGELNEVSPEDILSLPTYLSNVSLRSFIQRFLGEGHGTH